MKTKASEKITTIALPISDNERLTKYCRTYNILKKDFISIVLNFLETNGVDPRKDHAPKTELAKINKRINQLFAFIKTQDKEYLRPMLEAVQNTEFRLENRIQDLVSRQDLDPLVVKKDLEDFYTKEEQAILASNVVNAIIKNLEENPKLTEYCQEVLGSLEKIKNKKGFTL